MEKDVRPRRQPLSTQQRLKRQLHFFTGGSIVFFLGMGVMVYSHHQVAASLQQEIVSLIGILLSVVGGAISLVAYLGMSIGRLLRFVAPIQQGEKSYYPAPQHDNIDESNDQQARTRRD